MIRLVEGYVILKGEVIVFFYDGNKNFLVNKWYVFFYLFFKKFRYSRYEVYSRDSGC